MGETVNRYGSIVTRLTLMVTGILGAAVLAVGSLALLGQYRQLHHALATKADTMVQFMAQVSPLDILALNFVAMNNDVKKVVLTDDEAVYAILCNEQGIPLVHFFKETDPTMTGEVRDLVKGRKPLAAVAAMKRTSRILEVTAPITAGKKRLGSAVLGFSTDGVRQALLTQIAVIGMVLAAIIASSVALLRVVARRVLQPVQVLTNAANQISTGDLTVVVTGTDRTDELGVLSRAFERMAGQLRELIAGLEQRMSELRETGQALRESEIKYRRIVDTASEGICVLGPDTTITFVNTRMAEMLGRSAREMIGRSLADFMYEEDFPDHRVKMENRCRGFAESYERKFRHSCGEAVWTLVSATPILDEEHRYNGSFGMFTDITERKQAEEALKASEARFRRLTEKARDVIYRMSLPDGVYEYVSPVATELFGYSPEEFYDSPGLIREIVHADWRAYFEEEWSKLLRGEMPPTYEYQIVHKSGGVRWMNQRNILVRGDDGLIVAIEGIVTDVSERKSSEEELRKLYAEMELHVAERTADLNRKSTELSENQRALMNIVEDLNDKTQELEEANGKLKELDRLKSLFIASMSHELRTPLNSIIGFSHILHDEWIGPVNAEQKENLAIILRSGKHLLNLINDVIDVSKIEAGKIESTSEEFDLNELIDEAVSLIRKDLEEKKLELHVASVSLLLHSDRRRLLQCVLNLLSNAVKFTETGGVTVETRTVPDLKGGLVGEFAEISVTDTGIGIREEDLPKMFQPFVRLVSPLQATVPGTGLGLYLTRKLAVEVLKGDILMTSEYGKGSCLTIRMPVRVP